jgi:predicted phage-related endonuclease
MTRAFTIIDAPQRTPEWFAARAGRLTGSVAGEMLARIQKGEAASRRNLRLRLVLEQLTGRPQESDYVSPAMQAGIDREAAAFAAFEALTGEVAHRSGFLSHDSFMAGCSLDGHLGDFAELLSIKCRQPAAHYEFIRTQKVPADALAQMRHELWVTGAERHHYFSYNPDFPEKLQCGLVVFRRQDLDIDAYDQEARAFLAEVDVEVAAMRTLATLAGVLAEAV